MITYGLVKQVGPYSRNYPQSYQADNTEVIRPRYPYNPVIGLGDKSRYAARQVQDKEGIANPKLRKVQAIQKNREMQVRLDLSNLFGKTFMVADEADGTQPTVMPQTVVAEPDPSLSLREVLNQAVQYANVLMGQRERIRTRRTQTEFQDGMEDVEEPVVMPSEFTQTDEVADETAPGVEAETSTEMAQTVATQSEVPRSERSMQTEMEEMQRMDREVVGTLVQDEAVQQKMIETIDRVYQTMPTSVDAARDLITDRQQTLEDEVLILSQRMNDITSAISAARVSSVNPQVKRKSLLSQAVQVTTGKAVSLPKPRIQTNEDFVEEVLGRRLPGFTRLYNERYNIVQLKPRKKMRTIEEIGDEEPLYNEPQYQRQLEMMNETTPLGVLKNRYEKEQQKERKRTIRREQTSARKRGPNEDSGYSTGQ